jgi:hypothetical protein
MAIVSESLTLVSAGIYKVVTGNRSFQKAILRVWKPSSGSETSASITFKKKMAYKPYDESNGTALDGKYAKVQMVNSDSATLQDLKFTILGGTTIATAEGVEIDLGDITLTDEVHVIIAYDTPGSTPADWYAEIYLVKD